MALTVISSYYSTFSTTIPKVDVLRSSASLFYSPTSKQTSLASTWKRRSTSVISSAITPSVDAIPVLQESEETRRTGNFNAFSWDMDYLLTLESAEIPKDEEYLKEVEPLMEEIRSLIKADIPALSKLELVDTVQRLGLEYRFKEVEQDLLTLSHHKHPLDDLHAISLRFRLFRQHGIFHPPDDFYRFKGEDGKFKEELSDNVKGLLSMYEASFLALQGEDVLDEARIFATTNLNRLLEGGKLDPRWVKRVEHALDAPLHWRHIRLQARWFIEMYRGEDDFNSFLYKLAVLDFNRIQSVHRKDLGKEVRWLVENGFDKINFGRNFLFEGFTLAHGFHFEPQYSHARVVLSEIAVLISILDDIFDSYGSIEELRLLTDIAERWDISDIDKLPLKIRICFLALYNNCNEIGHQMLKERGFNTIPYLRKAWADMCRGFLCEAQWFHDGYKATLGEYMQNGLFSSGIHPLVVADYFLTSSELTEESMKNVDSMSPFVHTSATLFRYLNDCPTPSDEIAKGDTLKAIQCYMHEAGVSEEVAREHIMSLVMECWKKINGFTLDKTKVLSNSFMESVTNFNREAHFCYCKSKNNEVDTDMLSKEEILSRFFHPIELN